MTSTVEQMHARPRPDDQMDELFADGWPEFISADQEVKRHIGRVRDVFGHLELALLDTDDLLVAAGWAVSIQWSGDPSELPSGYTDSLGRALDDHDRSAEIDTLVIMAAQVHPARRGSGLASDLIGAFRKLATSHGWPRVVAPVRPVLKARYPLTPIERFAAWTRDDGLPLDPWIRTHARLGAKIIATAPTSQTMIGSVAQWEQWTGLTLPESGHYVIPNGLALLDIDIAADRGIYVEPNVWVRHQ